MMHQSRATLWCKLLGRLVEVELKPSAQASAAPGVPAGCLVYSCLDRAVECYGTGCPFTTDSEDTPFGAVGELPESPPETLDPSADPSFEGEWE